MPGLLSVALHLISKGLRGRDSGKYLIAARDFLEENNHRIDEIAFQVELVVVHLGWHVQIARLVRVARLIELLSVGVRNETVLLAVDNQDWATS